MSERALAHRQVPADVSADGGVGTQDHTFIEVHLYRYANTIVLA